MTHNREINTQPGSLSHSQPDSKVQGNSKGKRTERIQSAGQSIDLVFAGKLLYTAQNGQKRQCRYAGEPPKKHLSLRPYWRRRTK
ncbi:hypothetical protein DPMN_108775 [Dreissena polymorpha]|uniref:Uncharacterized protein n=1 Tax=Dreissena polymorpha TaxID=45954 RepID=A0A9D4K9J3_DREPO|nr:hypothetical protein DPMN_108775 [Dreissena polymorpha]